MRRVFISYCAQDQKWLERLQSHLKPLERDGRIELWDDTRVQPGDNGLATMRAAIAAADVAVLLLSVDFFASDVIASHVLPLLAAAAARGAVLLPVFVRACDYANAPGLSRLRPFNDPLRPLASLTKPQQEAALVELARAIVPAGTGPQVPAGPGADRSHQAVVGTARSSWQEPRRVDAAMPSQVTAQLPTECWVQICLPQSKGFRPKLPKVTAANEVIAKKDVRAETLGITFTRDAHGGKSLPARLRVELKAPDFKLEELYHDIQVFPETDSGLIVFMLVPLNPRPRSILHLLVRQVMPEREMVTLGTVALSAQIARASAPAASAAAWNLRELVFQPALAGAGLDAAAAGPQPLLERALAAADADRTKLTELAQYLQLSADLLYSLLPAFDERYKGTNFNQRGQTSAGREIFQEINSRLHDLLRRKLPTIAEYAQLPEAQRILLIARWLSEEGFVSAVPHLLLAALVVKTGSPTHA